MSEKNRFAELAKIDCSGQIEKKGKLSYLSWAWAWKRLMEIYPDSYSVVYEDPNGRPYFDDGKTAWVKTGVVLVDGEYQKENIEYLPIMNERNYSIPVKDVTSVAVNKAIQRSITKAIARHGIGLYIYAGEDLPESENAQETEPLPPVGYTTAATAPQRKPEEGAQAGARATPTVCERCNRKIVGVQINGKDINAEKVAQTTYVKTHRWLCYDCFDSGEY